MSQLPPDGIYSAKPVDPKWSVPAERPRTSGKAIASFVLSFFTPIFCIFTALPSVILGIMSLNQISRSQGRLKGGGFAVGGIVISAVCLFTLMPVLLLLPAINAAREAARRNGCLSNSRQLALAALNHESATKRFPLASDASTDLLRGQTAGGHGDAPAATDDGFSWLFQTLPYLEEAILYKEMKRVQLADESFTGPFDADFEVGPGSHFASTPVGAFRCPSFSGEMTTTCGGVEAAVGNYCALVATDLAEASAAPWKRTENWENGALPSACWKTHDSQTAATELGTCQERGISLRHLSDGTSKTLLCCESREQVYSAWISGASMWVVAASPNSLTAHGVTIDQGPDSYIAMLGSGTLRDGEGLALNFGDHRAAPSSDNYFQASDWATGQDRMWGPSSEHAGNGVIHAFVDCHAVYLSAEVDPTVYLRFVTRNDGDPASEDELMR